MKIYIGNYRSHWISPYTILEKVLFWKDWDNIDYDEPWVEKWSDRLKPISVAIQKILDVVHPKIDYVKIDRWDTWSMDHTLAKIILPMLKQLQATKHGSHIVDPEDVPQELPMTSTPDYSEQSTFEFYHEEKDVDYEIVHKRWDWVMNEMIFAFEHIVDDSWEEAYHKGVHDMQWIKSEKSFFNPVTNKEEFTYEMKKGPNDTYVCDYDGLQKVHDRMENGFRLFGKYYRGLWD